MPLDSSSTSSSERGGLRPIAQTVAATLCALAMLDAAVNLLLPMPADPRQQPSTLQRYFDYGRSIEGKLHYLVRDTDAASAPIVRSGWFNEPHREPALPAAAGGRLFAVYGQSMSHRVGHQIAALDESVTIRLRGGPGAPLGHSYEFFRRDRGQHRADVVVLGVVASGLRALTSMTTMGWAFEVPAPYTYPRWVVEAGELKAIQPVIQSTADLRRALADPASWQRFVAQLRAHDLSYRPSLFDAGLSDLSATLRAAKRGWGQRHQDILADRYHTPQGFVDNDGILTVARAIVRQFAAEVRADGAIPVVILFHDRGYGDDLYRALASTLIEHKVPFVSTHAIAPANEPSSFVPDGHFQRQFDEEFARRVLALAQADSETALGPTSAARSRSR
jgi:hypothetical protein